jgi:hypothetical protein
MPQSCAQLLVGAEVRGRQLMASVQLDLDPTISARALATKRVVGQQTQTRFNQSGQLLLFVALENVNHQLKAKLGSGRYTLETAGIRFAGQPIDRDFQS